MSKHRVMVKKLYCLISAVVILTCSISVFAMVPLDAEVTVDNIMEYANEYDPDGAFILQKAIDSRDKILRWYSEDQSILEGYDTGVGSRDVFLPVQGGRHGLAGPVECLSLS